MKSGFLLDVVICQGTSILQLLPGKDKPLLIWRNSLLVLDFGLHIINGVGALHLQGDCFASQCLDKDLHPSPETQDKMKCRFLLNIVVRQCAPILKLLPSKDKSLLVWWDALLVLDLGLNIVNCVRALDLQRDCLPSVFTKICIPPRRRRTK